jgi:hypothetical protein
MGKDNGVLRGACTAALVKIQILPRQIFTMAEVRGLLPRENIQCSGECAFALKKREKAEKDKGNG